MFGYREYALLGISKVERCPGPGARTAKSNGSFPHNRFQLCLESDAESLKQSKKPVYVVIITVQRCYATRNNSILPHFDFDDDGGRAATS